MINRLRALIFRLLITLRHRPLRLVGMIYSAVLGLFLWGVLSNYFLNHPQTAPITITAIVLGAVILWYFISHILQNVVIIVREDLLTKNFFNLFASPLSITEYGLSLVIASTIPALITTSVLAIIAYVLFTYNIFQFGLLLIPFLGILYLFAASLGLFAAGIIFRFGLSAEALSWSLPALIAPLSGVVHPISALPIYVQWIAYILPSTFVFEGMRNTLSNNNIDTLQLLIAGGLSVFYYISAFVFLSYAYRTILKREGLKKFLTD